VLLRPRWNTCLSVFNILILLCNLSVLRVLRGLYEIFFLLTTPVKVLRAQFLSLDWLLEILGLHYGISRWFYLILLNESIRHNASTFSSAGLRDYYLFFLLVTQVLYGRPSDVLIADTNLIWLRDRLLLVIELKDVSSTIWLSHCHMVRLGY